MNDPAVAIKDLLVTNAIGAFAAAGGWCIAIGTFPSAPDTVVLVNQSGGRNPFPHLALNFPSVQIMVRGAPSGYTAARTKMKDICLALLGMDRQTLNSDAYRSCNQIGDVIPLGQDDRGRPIFSANFWFIVEPSDLGNRKAIN